MNYEFGEPKWITDDRGNKIPIYDGLDFKTCVKVREHHRRLQSMVDTYKEKYKTGVNAEYVDNCMYVFIVKKKSRKVKLIEGWL
jgi:hypothetical protein